MVMAEGPLEYMLYFDWILYDSILGLDQLKTRRFSPCAEKL